MWKNSIDCGTMLADLAVMALLEEAELTPKPGLVDLRSSGSHSDMDISLMRASAVILRSYFEAMGKVAFRREPNRELREELAFWGRAGEEEMMRVTNGVNTHRGAIWSIGLLVAGAAVHGEPGSAAVIAATAGSIAKFADKYTPVQWTNGMEVMRKYGIRGARGEAMAGFPHAVRIGLPVLQEMRSRKIPEETAKLYALLAIMSCLQDSCILYRGGLSALVTAQQGARRVLESGGIATAAGQHAYFLLEQTLLEQRLSPGGSADLLAAVLFLDKIQNASYN